MIINAIRAIIVAVVTMTGIISTPKVYANAKPESVSGIDIDQFERLKPGTKRALVIKKFGEPAATSPLPDGGSVSMWLYALNIQNGLVNAKAVGLRFGANEELMLFDTPTDAPLPSNPSNDKLDATDAGSTMQSVEEQDKVAHQPPPPIAKSSLPSASPTEELLAKARAIRPRNARIRNCDERAYEIAELQYFNVKELTDSYCVCLQSHYLALVEEYASALGGKLRSDPRYAAQYKKIDNANGNFERVELVLRKDWAFDSMPNCE